MQNLALYIVELSYQITYDDPIEYHSKQSLFDMSNFLFILFWTFLLLSILIIIRSKQHVLS